VTAPHPHLDPEPGERGFVVGVLLVVFTLGVLCGALIDRFFCGGC
jgi:hypothetical protein